ncbi:MAG: hypothetical protein ACI8RE_001129 [Ilumatobacter sp.]|jgi:uncharacterized protein YxjI
MTTPPDWHPDPNGRADLRYWDGAAWTEHVSTGGVQSTDPVGGGVSRRLDSLDKGLTVGNEGQADKIQQQLTGQSIRGAGLSGKVEGGGGTILTEPVLVVNQKAKLIELNNQYSVFGQDGQQLAMVNQVGQSAAKKAMRLVSSLDQFMTHKLQITDNSGQVLLQLTRPRKLMKSTVIVEDAAGNEIGKIVQQKAIGKINFGIETNGQMIGSIKGENWRAWNFRIEDAQGTEVARISKTFEGFAKTMFTTADNYVVQIHQRMPEPLNTLIVASALSIDTALKQDNRGFG